MDAMVESVAVALKGKLSADERRGLMLKIGPDRSGARLVAIGKAGRWVDAVIAVDVDAVGVNQCIGDLWRQLQDALGEARVA